MSRIASVVVGVALLLCWSQVPYGQENPPAFVLEWGTSGSGNGQFRDPIGLAVDAAGNIYVADQGNDRIQAFDSNGAFLTTWGTTGSGEGQFLSPWGVAADAAGNVYVSDSRNDRIQTFDSNGAFLTTWGTTGSGEGQFRRPRGVAVDAAGNVYVTDLGNRRIQKFDSSGAFLTTWGTQGSGEGRFEGPTAVVADAAGNVYVSDSRNDRIQKFDSNGAFLTRWGGTGFGDGQLRSPRGLAVDAAGNIYVADQGNDRVQTFDSNGVFLTTWGTTGSGDGQFDNLPGVAVDTTGNVYVVEVGNSRIQKFDGNALLLMTNSEAISAQGPSDALEEVRIGTQVWSVRNLDVDHFRNGDPIPQAETAEEWLSALDNLEPAWCYYENDSLFGTLQGLSLQESRAVGKLYNWFAVNDPRGLAPEGWHVPSLEEWDTLSVYLGGIGVADKKMMIALGGQATVNSRRGSRRGSPGATAPQQIPDSGNGGTNSSGFTGLPGGTRHLDGRFTGYGVYGYWWSSTKVDTGLVPSFEAWYRELSFLPSRSTPGDAFNFPMAIWGDGLSVRVVRN